MRLPSEEVIGNLTQSGWGGPQVREEPLSEGGLHVRGNSGGEGPPGEGGLQVRGDSGEGASR